MQYVVRRSPRPSNQAPEPTPRPAKLLRDNMTIDHRPLTTDYGLSLAGGGA